MCTSIKPFGTQFIPEKLDFQPCDKRVRKLCEMRGLFFDNQAYTALLAERDQIMYEMLVAEVPEEEGHLLHSVTVMYPGTVGNEFFMTSGHYHLDQKASEVYYCLAGQGILLVMDRDGRCESIPMTHGTVAYIPPGWAHRTANTGKTPFVFLAVWPSDAGHDYGKIKEIGFSKLVIQSENDNVQLVDNPRFKLE
jgi:glucose-6-phosphate isomerase, archaeal